MFFLAGTLPFVDLAVVVAYLAAAVGFGLWMGRRPRDLEDFLVGGRDVPWMVVLLSIVATETSTATFLSVPGIGYASNLTFLQLALGYIVGRLAVTMWILPAYFRGRLVTAYELLGERFGQATRRATSVLFLVTRTVADGLRLFLTALVLQKITGWSLESAIVALTILTVVYTMAGGMRAVLWMDCVQLCVYVLGAVLAAWILWNKIPGTDSEILQRAWESGHLQLFDFDWAWDNASFLGAGLVGGAFLTLATHGADQLIVQRLLSAKSRQQAGLALSVSGFVVAAQFALFLGIGVLLWLFYTAHPPAEPFASNDQVFSSFIVDHLRDPPGVLGIILGAVFSAAMSTLSSSLNSSAATAVHDLYLPLRGASPDHGSSLKVTRWFTLGFGVLQGVVALAAKELDSSVVLQVLAIAGLASGIVLGLFFLALARPRTRPSSALIALTAGIVGMAAIKFATPLAWPWYAVVGSLGTFVVGALVDGVGRTSAAVSESR